ncbi:unnamed protein product [Symbiodinium natans]|uniref:Retrovirus-related Pol polyprotein from transposon TNT 1-94 n=1 Tax=Symbiodinium natans TaxID=878477 RepID=A0A812TA31_9DINO|nr:unnamed protein product [Symbiodinium natans]
MGQAEQQLVNILQGVAQTQAAMTQTQAALTKFLQEQDSAKGSSSLKGRDLAKVLKQPPPLVAKNRDEELGAWPSWSWEFEQWLTVLDPAFTADLASIKAKGNNVITEAELSDEQKERSKLLYGILAGLLHDKGKRLLRSIGGQNGFEGYRSISADLMPSNRTRALALLQAINSWPTFENKHGIAQQLLKLEAAMNEYETLQRGGLTEDTKIAAVLRWVTGQLRQHVNVLVTDTTTYDEVRALVLRWDAAQQRWSHSVAQSYGLTVAQQPASSEAAPTVAPSSSASNAAPSVRRIELRSFDMTGLAFSGNSVHMVTAVPHYDMSSSDDDSDWVLCPGLCDPSAEGSSDSPSRGQHLEPMSEPFSVCAVSSQQSRHSRVILDSGADLSCLPRSFCTSGKAARSRPMSVQDAQGGSMKVHQERNVEFILTARDQEPVLIKERCIVADVVQPILSMGRLIHQGWFPSKDSEGLHLCHERGSIEVPVGFKGHSLVVDAVIRRIDGEDVEQHVRAYTANVSEDLSSMSFGWQIMASGHLAWRGMSERFVDPTYMTPENRLMFRTTLVRQAGRWIVLEQCVDISELDDLEAQAVPNPCEMIVVMSSSAEPTAEFGVFDAGDGRFELSDLGPPDAAAANFWGDTDAYDDVEVPDALIEASEEVEAGVGPLHEGGPDSVLQPVMPDAQEVAPAVESPPEEVVVDEVRLSVQSAMNALRAGCRSLGLATSGSRLKLFSRLKGYVERQRLSLSMELADDAANLAVRDPHVQAQPRVPSLLEQRLHEVTHTPYQPWCPHCTVMKAMPDRHEELKERGPRDIPSVSFDFMYTGYDMQEPQEPSEAAGPGNDDNLCCLVAHDTDTGSILCVPCVSKGDARYLGAELMRFCQNLGHVELELRTLSLQNVVVAARHRLGLRTVVRNAPVGSHQAKGYVEKAVHSVRSLANVLLDMVRAKSTLDIGVAHPLFSWAFTHSAWILNRFRVLGGLTAYERTHHSRYCGKLVPFGEPVYAQVIPRRKGNPKWILSIFLSKSVSNDMYIVASKTGVRLCRSVRRTGLEWSKDKSLFEGLKGLPWDFSSGVVGTRFVPLPKYRKPQTPATPTVPAVPVIENSAALDEAASDPPSTPARTPLYTPDLSEGNAVTPMSPIVHDPLQAAPRTPPLARSVAPPASVAPATGVPRTPAAEVMNPALSFPQPGTPEHELPPLGPILEDEMLADEIGRDDDNPRASKAPRIRAVTFGKFSFDVNDDLLDRNASEWQDATTYVSMIDSAQASGELGVDAFHETEIDGFEPGQDHVLSQGDRTQEKAGTADESNASALWFPDTGHGEPELSESELWSLDRLADDCELNRLLKKGVLRQASSSEEGSDMKRLSSKFVRTWRRKKKGGKAMFLRRSRLVAREFRWLEADKEGLFSPSTATDIVRLLPALFVSWSQSKPGEQYALLALDIKDAYLEVCQEEPLMCGLPSDYDGDLRYSFVFEKMIPGQRNGSQRWFSHYIDFLRANLQVEQCLECPAVLRTEHGPAMVHVDDSLTLAPLTWIHSAFLPLIKSRFECTYEVAMQVGDTFDFLKRKHTITEHGILIEMPKSYIKQMAETLGVNYSHSWKHKSPCHPDLLGADTSPALDEAKASKFRSAVGIGLYISADRYDVCFAVRMLSAYMQNPTELAWRCAIRMVQYLVTTQDYATLVKPGPPGTSILSPNAGGSHLLEVYSDADWSGNKKHRRSIGSASYTFDGACVYHSCRTQKVVSLSSMESEWYAAISSTCQGVYLQAVIRFLTCEDCILVVRLDNAAARQFGHRQGVGRAKHIQGRLLWLQSWVQQKLVRLLAVPTALNLGDLSTKSLSSTRLRGLLFLHGFVSGSTLEPIGQEEYEEIYLKNLVRERVHRVIKTSNIKQTLMIALLTSLPQGTLGLETMPTSTTKVLFFCALVCFTGGMTFRALSLFKALEVDVAKISFAVSGEQMALNVLVIVLTMMAMVQETWFDTWLCFGLLLVIWVAKNEIAVLHAAMKEKDSQIADLTAAAEPSPELEDVPKYV